MKKRKFACAFFLSLLILSAWVGGHKDEDSLFPALRLKPDDAAKREKVQQVLRRVGTDDDDGHKCGTADLTRRQAWAEETRLRATLERRRRGRRALRLLKCDEIANQTSEEIVTIPIHLHLMALSVSNNNGEPQLILPHPTSSFIRLLESSSSSPDDGSSLQLSNFSTPADIEAMFVENLAVVNEAFADTSFRFVQGNATVTDNFDWVLDIGLYLAQASAAVGSGDLRELDLFVGFAIEVDDLGILGRAVPSSVQRAGKGDGIAIIYDVLTGGGFPGWEEGHTLTHEIGHWLGLFHTFQIFWASSEDNPCQEREVLYNDFVEDTPIQNGPSRTQLPNNTSCLDYLETSDDEMPDTCPEVPGKDPFWNYMNYLDTDVCWARRGEFTCGQIERMHLHWHAFRDAVPACDDPDTNMEIEMIFVADSFYLEDLSQIRLLNAETNEVIFDSVADHLLFYALYADEVVGFEVDLCVSRNFDYRIEVSDGFGLDGFGDGSLTVFVDGQEFEVVDSSDGRFETINIIIPGEQSSPVPAPTSRPTITNQPTEKNCFPQRDSLRACVADQSCALCLDDAYETFTESDTKTCDFFQSTMCEAITVECTTCSACQFEAVDFFECVAVTAGCSIFLCIANPPPSGPPSQGPTNQPTVQPICSAESDALTSCTAGQNCATCLEKTSDSSLAISNAGACKLFQSTMCEAISVDCSSCNACEDVAENLYQCIADTFGCSSFQCTTSLPTTAPTPVAVSPICATELENARTCIDQQNVFQRSCTECLETAFDSIAPNSEKPGCSIYMSLLCRAIQMDCTTCSACMEEVEGYYSCISIAAGCPNLECTPPAGPTELSSTAPPTSLPSDPGVPLPSASHQEDFASAAVVILGASIVLSL